MTAEDLFSGLNLIATAGWVLLVLLPRRRWATDVAAGKVIPAILALVYVAILAAEWRGSKGGFSSLADVATLFSNPWLLLAGWTHYLAFDLFVGSWEVKDARERGISHLLVVPCLILTFLFGPAGLLLYWILRSAHGAVIRRESGASPSKAQA